jgi:hypothetical protein
LPAMPGRSVTAPTIDVIRNRESLLNSWHA